MKSAGIEILKEEQNKKKNTCVLCTRAMSFDSNERTCVKRIEPTLILNNLISEEQSTTTHSAQRMKSIVKYMWILLISVASNDQIY